MLNTYAAAAIAFCRAQLGKPYKMGALGPDRWDCRGLIRKAFGSIGLLPLVGGALPNVRAFVAWSIAHNRLRLASSGYVPQPGDVFFWGPRAGDHRPARGHGHMGIVTGPGRALSAYNPQRGVIEHAIAPAPRSGLALYGFLVPDWPAPGTGPQLPPPTQPPPSPGGYRPPYTGAPADPAAAAGALAVYVTAPLGQLASSTAATGWCVFLGKPGGSPLTNDDAGKILSTVAKAIDDGAGIQFLNPLWWPIRNGAIQAIAARLQQWVAGGTTCDQIPPNLATDPEIDKAIPDRPGEVIGPAINFALDLTGLGALLADLGPKLLFLGGVLVLLIMGIRRVLD